MAEAIQRSNTVFAANRNVHRWWRAIGFALKGNIVETLHTFPPHEGMYLLVSPLSTQMRCFSENIHMKDNCTPLKKETIRRDDGTSLPSLILFYRDRLRSRNE